MAERTSGLLGWFRGDRGGSDASLPAKAALAPRSPVLVLTERLEDLGEIGRGSMASVRRVRDRNLLRQTAMKVIAPHVAAIPGELERFIGEAQITGQLDHPNIPPVYEVGADDEGTHFFTMKYVHGTTFEQMLRRKEFSVTDERELFSALQVLLKVCDALAFAHSRGVLHCDLKPANVMVGAFGQVYVMDWGIARITEKADGTRRTIAVGMKRQNDEGVVIGSAGYMSPEQARGLNDSLDERSDIFSLGAMLYRVLTGRPPYQGGKADQLLALAADASWTPPAQVVPNLVLPQRLCAIAEKAMAFDHAQRYQSVEEMRADLEAFLHGPGRLPIRTFAAGSLIVREGDPGNEAFAILQGKCVVFKNVDGRRHILREMGPGEVFGEMALLAAEKRTASVETLGEVRVAVLSVDTLVRDLGQTMLVGRLVKALAGRFHDVDRRATALTREIEDLRLRDAVLEHFALHGAPREGGGRVAPWSPLRSRLAAHLSPRADVAAELARRIPGVSVSEPEDKVTLTQLRPVKPPPPPDDA